jgi:hypothetical protein
MCCQLSFFVLLFRHLSVCCFGPQFWICSFFVTKTFYFFNLDLFCGYYVFFSYRLLVSKLPFFSLCLCYFFSFFSVLLILLFFAFFLLNDQTFSFFFSLSFS